MAAAVRTSIGALATTLLLVGCTFSTGAKEGATTGTGDNSAFTEAGVDHILDEGSARIDLRAPLMKSDLGAADGELLRDVDVRGDDPIEVTVRGTGGDLVVAADVVRVLISPDGGAVQSIALFEHQADGDALGARLAQVGDLVGVDRPALDSFVASLDGGRRDIWLNGGRSLGFTVGLHPVHDPAEDSLIEYQLTPPA